MASFQKVEPLYKDGTVNSPKDCLNVYHKQTTGITLTLKWGKKLFIVSTQMCCGYIFTPSFSNQNSTWYFVSMEKANIK